MGKRIDFEAHYYTPEVIKVFTGRTVPPLYDPVNNLVRYSKEFTASNPRKLKGLLHTPEERIADMDSVGTDIQILSASMGYELLDPEDSVEMCRIANDTVAAWMQQYPGRFSGYASLPVKDKKAAAAELERCMKQLGFFGWGAFSNFGPTALDDDEYYPLLECAAGLGAPVYIHPAIPYEGRLTGMGPLLLGGGAGFGIDTVTTLLRLILKGVFDRLPELKVLVGHLGEGLPFTMDRLSARSVRPGLAPAVNKESAAHYFSKNIWVSSSGVFSYPSFRCARDVLGIDRILFGSDYPYEAPQEVEQFLSGLDFTGEEKALMFSGNAEKHFGF